MSSQKIVKRNIFFIVKALCNNYFRLVDSIRTKLTVSDSHFSLIFQIPCSSQQNKKNIFQIFVWSLTCISQKNCSDSGLVLNKKKHLSLFDSFEVNPLATANNISYLVFFDIEQIVNSLLNQSQPLNLRQIFRFYFRNQHNIFL